VQHVVVFLHRASRTVGKSVSFELVYGVVVLVVVFVWAELLWLVCGVLWRKGCTYSSGIGSWRAQRYSDFVCASFPSTGAIVHST